MESEQCAKSDWTRITDQVATLKAELEKAKTHGSDMVKLEQVQYDRASKLEHENEGLQEELSAAKQLVSEYQDLYRSAQKERDELLEKSKAHGSDMVALARVTKASAPLTELLEISAMLNR